MNGDKDNLHVVDEREQGTETLQSVTQAFINIATDICRHFNNTIASVGPCACQHWVGLLHGYGSGVNDHVYQSGVCKPICILLSSTINQSCNYCKILFTTIPFTHVWSIVGVTHNLWQYGETKTILTHTNASSSLHGINVIVDTTCHTQLTIIDIEHIQNMHIKISTHKQKEGATAILEGVLTIEQFESNGDRNLLRFRNQLIATHLTFHRSFPTVHHIAHRPNTQA